MLNLSGSSYRSDEEISSHMDTGSKVAIATQFTGIQRAGEVRNLRSLLTSRNAPMTRQLARVVNA